MLEKQALEMPSTIELALPSVGFSQAFISDVRGLCAEYEKLIEGYILLKKSDDDVSLLFCLLFEIDTDAVVIETSVARLAQSILDLFTDKMAIDVICLNGNKKLTNTVRSITAPFYIRPD